MCHSLLDYAYLFYCPSTPEEKAAMLKIPYCSLVGALMWIAIMTRPDIFFAAVHLAQFNSNPSCTHWNVALHVLGYLKGTKDYSLVLGGGVSNRFSFMAYCDADWANDMDNGHSISGYAFILDGAFISWSSKKQSSVALSSTEAEYYAAGHALKQLLHLQYILGELGIDYPSPTMVYSDSTGAISCHELVARLLVPY
jgi:ribonuclease HI